jgi:hypothetical protein
MVVNGHRLPSSFSQFLAGKSGSFMFKNSVDAFGHFLDNDFEPFSRVEDMTLRTALLERHFGIRD